MAKEVAVSKRLKISEAQQYMLLSVLVASVFLGIALALSIRFVNQISFNANVIAVEEQSIVSYSEVIASTGVCTKPKGTIYSDEELAKCDPASIEVADIPDTLRANILENLASNEALASVTREDNSTCINPSTNKNYTLKELNELYSDARGADELQTASNLIKSCSALRAIPDALPAFKNEEALLASLNKLFILSGWMPEVLRPDEADDLLEVSSAMNVLPVSLLVESNTGTTLSVLNNIERSIREFNIYRATIEWGSDDTLILQARAAAYYVDPSVIEETTITVSGETGKAITDSNNTTGDEEE